MLLREYERLHETLAGYLLEQQTQSNSDVEAPTPEQHKAARAQIKGQIAQLRAKMQEGSFVDSEDLQCLKPYCLQGPAKELLATLWTQLAEFDMEAGVLSLNAIEQSLQQD
jgi:hypothetical protein